jgi:hypothetical protein
MNLILIIILSFVALFIIQSIVNKYLGIDKTITTDVVNILNDNIKKGNDHVNKNIKDVKKQTEINPKFKDPFYKFPDPMLSNISHPLSKGFKPMYEQLNQSSPDMSDLDIIRKSTLEYYVRDPVVFNPAYIKKDTIDAAPGDYTNQGIAKKYNKKEKQIGMTSSKYITKYPKYADSNIVNELTNVGYFFDTNDNNKYKYNQQKTLPEGCELNGESLKCKLNGELQEIPNTLLNYNSDVVNSIGVVVNDTQLIQSPNNYQYGLVDGKDYQIWNYPDDKPMNGGGGFDVYASNSLGDNETYASVSNRLGCKSCSI